jgi:hypothetical protein
MGSRGFIRNSETQEIVRKLNETLKLKKGEASRNINSGISMQAFRQSPTLPLNLRS